MIDRSNAATAATGDSTRGYGWISIFLHWVTAAAIGYLWFVGDTLAVIEAPGERARGASLHVSVALCVYLLFLARIAWRATKGFPQWEGQKRYDRILSRLAQNAMLLCLVAMIVTGPLLLLAGSGIEFFGLFTLPGPVIQDPALVGAAALVHARAAALLMIIMSLHICGAFKHLMFHDDDIFLRMLVPPDRQADRDSVTPADRRLEEPGR